MGGESLGVPIAISCATMVTTIRVAPNRAAIVVRPFVEAVAKMPPDRPDASPPRCPAGAADAIRAVARNATTVARPDRDSPAFLIDISPFALVLHRRKSRAESGHFPWVFALSSLYPIYGDIPQRE
jgi:hypothetical protein